MTIKFLKGIGIFIVIGGGYMSDSKENVDVLKMYGEDSTTQRDEFLKKHNLNEKGLTSKQAEINIKKFGLNETKKAKPKKWYNYLLQSLLTPFNCILIGISIILIYNNIKVPRVKPRYFSSSFLFF